MHIVSGVQGELDERYDQFDLFAASFPAGTLVGAPKVRAMEIIEEMEQVGRGLYAGTAGYFGLSGDMDQAITIRTLVFTDGEYSFQAGAGIVADSVPAREYQEVLAKSAILRRAFRDFLSRHFRQERPHPEVNVADIGASDPTAERYFDAEWAKATIRHAVKELKQELCQLPSGIWKPELIERLLLKLSGQSGASYEELAREFEMHPKSLKTQAWRFGAKLRKKIQAALVRKPDLLKMGHSGCWWAWLILYHHQQMDRISPTRLE